jgi:magnesium-transporting ATPase (P-type)
MLWVAAALAIAAGLPELAIAITAVILLNGVFAFIQETRADRAADALTELLPRRARVIRDGSPKEVDAAALVVGDLVLLEAGDRIAADLQTIGATEARIDESLLTGESLPSGLSAGQTAFAGTFLAAGEASGIVSATGARTRLARIAKLASGPAPQPPIVVEIRRVVRTISVIAVCVGVLFFVASILLGQDPKVGFLFGLGVTVALVPEALLPTVTLSLALGAQRMAARHALIRNLESVETLGSTTFICTDKTGTLTRNEMTVVDVWTPAGSVQIPGRGYEPAGSISVHDHRLVDSLHVLGRAAARCSTGRVVVRDGRWVPLGDPLEAALDVLARKMGIDIEADRIAHPDRRRFPFDPRTRQMSIVVGDEIFTKGAPDVILPRCRPTAVAPHALDEMTERGLRVIAVGRQWLGKGAPLVEPDALDSPLELLGLIGLEDPPRPQAARAVAASRAAGVKVAMVTGDHLKTAASVAREVGLCVPGAPVLSGSDLPLDDESLGELVDHDGIVLARVEPEAKLRIARVLRARGHVVAMTGDGVNDAPALKEADIGVAMGRSGTDVAREASDLILLDDDFATIVTAIEFGRSIYANVRRFLTYHLTDNVAEVTPFVVWALSGGRFPLALGVLQILALDIGTDTLSATALGAEPPVADQLRSRPAGGRLLNAVVMRRAFGLLGPTEAITALLAFVASYIALGWRPGDPFPRGSFLAAASGATFATVVIAQTANAFACRSTTMRPGQLGWFSNPLLVWAALVEIVIAGAFLIIPPLAHALGQRPPPTAGWLVALASAPLMLAVDAVWKWRRRSRFGPGAGTNQLVN